MMRHLLDQLAGDSNLARRASAGSRTLATPNLSLARQAGVALALVWMLGVGPVVNAQDEDDERVAPAGERQFVITEEQFDQMVFGGRQAAVRVAQPVQVVQGVKGMQQIVVAVQPAEMDFRKRMEAATAVEIQAVDGRVSLTDAQKKKLRLAARGDIAKLVERAAELRPKLTAKPMNQQEYVELMRELQPLRMSQQFGIISESSLFRKTLQGTLTDEQRARWRAVQRERQKAIIQAAFVQLNAQQTPVGTKLTAESQQKLTELILDHGRLPQSVGPYGQYIVLLEANLLRDRVKPLLSVEEWDRFESQVGQAKRYVPTLESYGLWTERRSDTKDNETDDEETKD